MLGKGVSIQSSFRGNSGTSPGDWFIPIVAGTTYNTAAAAIADSANLVTQDASVGRFVVSHAKPMVQLAFHVTDADNETIAFTVYGARKFVGDGVSGWSYASLLSGVATAGSKVFNAGSWFWADTITISSAALPSTAYRACNSTNDIAWLEIDMRDLDYLVVVITRSGQTGASGNLLVGGCTL